MNLTIDRKALLAALAAVKPAATPKAAMPILANVAIVADEKVVTFTATDLDLTLRTSAEAAVMEVGQTTVRCGLFHDIVKSLNGETVELELLKDTLKIICGPSRVSLSVIDIEEMPPFPRIKDAVEFGIQEHELHRVLAGTDFAHAEDDARPVLKGACLVVDGNLKSIGADGRRMAMDAEELSGGVTSPKGNPHGEKLSLILPAPATGALCKLLCQDSEKAKLVNILAGANLVQFRFDRYTVITKLIEGEYPDVGKIIPKIDAAAITINRGALLEACQRIALLGDSCRLKFNKETLTITSRGGKEGDALESIPITKTKEVTVTMATSYLIDALSATDSMDIEVLVEEDKPIVFKAPGREWMSLIAGMKS